ncbi:hypothetical protein N7522_000218 [Penicillium canescens]|uniref:LysM domain-containing protein n=1 Tax=Penicillium canescens TaxID=5083 RepID=A0AAD6N6Y2_PENCN|nr:uncharacterized protein N7446_012363 [Penicillium canescens]KAJ6020143.1 hypothetical protein N7522_000218 [Penicillium canescens]KAJ6038090.1 hypothetical protein N7460_007861 [Penicillium canescens]KAJ6045499.1 hypothetical protein N7446_012363 [Penicillium canescens]KAJ6061180.1 hypothetical protein N7444_001876 [Penicillium canescens]
MAYTEEYMALRIIVCLAGFYSWNPAVGSSCSYLDVGDYVCVDILGYTITTTSTTSGGISTPSPIQSGMVCDCDKFHLVQPGDTCSAVASTAGISLDDFYAWNPAVGTSCAYLDMGDYVCVDIPGVTPTATAS